MDQTFLVVIDTDKKVTCAQCFSYEQDEYNCIKKNGEVFRFLTEDACHQWIMDNINFDQISDDIIKSSNNNFDLYAKIKDEDTN